MSLNKTFPSFTENAPSGVTIAITCVRVHQRVIILLFTTLVYKDKYKTLYETFFSSTICFILSFVSLCVLYAHPFIQDLTGYGFNSTEYVLSYFSDKCSQGSAET